MSDDRLGTVKFLTCEHAVHAGDGEYIEHYCCSQSEIMKSGKHPLELIKDGNEYLRVARLGLVLIDDGIL